MAAKQKPDKEKVAETSRQADGRESRVVGEPESSFDERTQELQPWQGTEGVDDTRPEPQIEKVK